MIGWGGIFLMVMISMLIGWVLIKTGIDDFIRNFFWPEEESKHLNSK